MAYALLITANEYLRTEFEQIVAITGFELHISAQPHQDQIRLASHVFIDEHVVVEPLSHPAIWVVTSGPAGPATWKIATEVGAQRIVSLPDDRSLVTACLATSVVHRARCTAIVPLVNGIGSTTMSCFVAAELSKTINDVVLVDMDFRSGGLAILLGTEREQPVLWPDVMQNFGSHTLEQLPTWNGLRYVAGPTEKYDLEISRRLEVLGAITSQAQHVVLDGLHINDVANVADFVDDLCFVVPNTLRGIAIARASLNQLKGYQFNMGLVVRNILGSALAEPLVAQTLELPLWASIPSEPRVVEVTEQGLGPVTLRSGSYSRAISHLMTFISEGKTHLRAA